MIPFRVRMSSTTWLTPTASIVRFGFITLQPEFVYSISLPPLHSCSRAFFLFFVGSISMCGSSSCFLCLLFLELRPRAAAECGHFSVVVGYFALKSCHLGLHCIFLLPVGVTEAGDERLDLGGACNHTRVFEVPRLDGVGVVVFLGRRFQRWIELLHQKMPFLLPKRFLDAGEEGGVLVPPARLLRLPHPFEVVGEAIVLVARARGAPAAVEVVPASVRGCAPQCVAY
mmetsp:Transcript_26528/g.54036  ORF Transcript_26528/g.54036 Transcript_26528/m.54036 type:complete len:228 (-) Transcript_26528:381-1064(-)